MGRRAALAAAAVSIMFVTGVASGASSWGSAPVNVTPPSISGTSEVGMTLTARYGKWRGKNLKYAYSWLRCDSTGRSCGALGVSQSTYVLVSSDAGSTMRVAVTASSPYGSTVATSAATSPVLTKTPPTTVATMPANTTLPTISGSPQQGQTLTATTGSWGGSTPLNYAYQWQRCDSSGASCTPLSNTGTTDVLSSADVGSTIRVSVTADNTAGSATATSAPTAAVAALPVSAPAPAPAPAPGSTVFCFGDPAFSTGGFSGNYTSNGWGRQYPYLHPERVSYDDSVSVMQSLGCHTIKAELRSGDLDTKGGTVNLRAQAYKDPSPTLYDTMGTNPGQTTWYGFAFSTNTGYVPQSDPNSPNWNVVFSWHGTVSGGGNPASIEIATKAVSTTACGSSTTYVPWTDGKPHLMLEVNGGDPARWPTGGATCLRFSGPVFVPGSVYRVQEKVTWSDNYQGAVEWWVNGVKYADVTGVCTLQLGGNVYPLFENYRPFAVTFPTADIYYGGMIKGSSQAEVTVP